MKLRGCHVRGAKRDSLIRQQHKTSFHLECNTQLDRSPERRNVYKLLKFTLVAHFKLRLASTAVTLLTRILEVST